MVNRSLRHLWIAGAVILAGCASIGRPTVTQIATDPPIFLLAFRLSFSPGDKKQEFSVPPGFVTDLASIPRGLWWWQAPHEGTLAPAIVHDFLYWEQPCTKDEADAVMYVAMKQTGMRDVAVNLVYAGIRTQFAQDSWDKNLGARTRGEKRFFTSVFSSQLASGDLDPKATLATIQSAAEKHNGALAPELPLARIKAVCRAAYEEFEALRAL